ncbi:MAG: hypothetical protein EZS28_054781, partial [Streblomastix strix]
IQWRPHNGWVVFKPNRKLWVLNYPGRFIRPPLFIGIPKSYKEKKVVYFYNIIIRFKQSNLTLQINNVPKSLYIGRQQKASTTVEVRIWREKALTPRTEAPLALNFVIVA